MFGIHWLIMVHYWPGMGIVRGDVSEVGGGERGGDYKITFFFDIKIYNLVAYK